MSLTRHEIIRLMFQKDIAKIINSYVVEERVLTYDFAPRPGPYQPGSYMNTTRIQHITFEVPAPRKKSPDYLVYLKAASPWL